MIINDLNQLPPESVSHNPAISKRVMLRSGDVPHLTNFSQAHFATGQIAPGHAHEDMWEVFFVTAGYGIIRINGKEYSLSPGVCVTVEPGEVHQIENNGAEELILTYFGLRVAHTINQSV